MFRVERIQANLAVPVPRSDLIDVGVSQDRTTFGRDQLVGDQGVQVIVTEAGGQKFAYILWDGNNAVPGSSAFVIELPTGVAGALTARGVQNHVNGFFAAAAVA